MATKADTGSAFVTAFWQKSRLIQSTGFVIYSKVKHSFQEQEQCNTHVQELNARM